MSFYLFRAISFYHNIAILYVKISCVTWASRGLKGSTHKRHGQNITMHLGLKLTVISGIGSTDDWRRSSPRSSNCEGISKTIWCQTGFLTYGCRCNGTEEIVKGLCCHRVWTRNDECVEVHPKLQIKLRLSSH